MRILSVRIRNLNSLVGDWTIRLDGAEYEAGGIFAITGPTGAGKSTILDAVCLALYGCTPRLGKVAKSGNEIMSRQTAECLAEVRFRTPKGEYLCSWSQHRAGKKLSGNFQQPKHRLYDAQGRAVAEKTSEVIEKVTELTGMDFSRFTQSMLLAQGRFASFLLADGDDRAPLLEQITGTEIYSKISRKIHERHREETLRLAALDEELAARDLLSEEEERRIGEELEELRRSTAALTREEEARRRDAARLDLAEALDREERALEQEKEKLRLDEARFEDDGKRLTLARKAAGPAALFEAVSVRREEQRRDRERRDALADELPQLREAAEAARTALTAAREALEQARAKGPEERALRTRVRALDTELDRRRRELAALDRELAGRSEALRTGKLGRDAAERARRRSTEALEKLRGMREATAADDALADAAGAMQARLAMLEKEDGALDRTRQTLNARRGELQTLRNGLAERRRAAETAQQELAAARTRRDEVNRQLDALLQGRDLPSWRSLQQGLTGRKHLLEKALEGAEQRRERLEAAARKEEEARRLETTLLQEESALEAGRLRLASLRETLELRRRIRSYEEERRHLREGVPCPLCGSPTHPFVRSGAPDDSADDGERELAALERQLETLAADLASHRRDAVHTSSALKENRERATRMTETLRELAAGLASSEEGADDAEGVLRLNAEETKALLSSLALTEQAPELAPLLERLRQKTEEELQDASRILRAAGALEERGRTLERRAEELTRLREGAAIAEAQGEKEEVRLVAETEALAGEVARGSEKVLQERRALCGDVKAFGLTADSTEELRAAVNLLAERRDRRAALLKEEADTLQQLHERSRALAVAAEAVEAAEREFEEARRTRQAGEAEAQALAEQRAGLFGSRSPDEEEKTAESRLKALEEAESRCRTALEGTERRLAESRSADEALRAGMAQRAQDLQVMETTLGRRLADEGFENEAACRAALLQDDDLHALEKREQELSDRSVSLQARAAQLARRRQEDTAPLPSREDNERELERIRGSREQALQRTGSLRERLSVNDAHREEAALIRQKRETQAEICRRWKALDELAGSSEGKTFRNYAQELTFRRLLLLANRQLAFMTDRYVLVHSTQEKLTLNVVDRYQADAVRSSRNLSGGESFLVSLALALGLSQMASRNVRVDSVFLDEGFGSLDEEALNTALDMLAALHRKGKMIGIISHVQAVRDRIGLQIRVTPEGGGRSRLSGPGVSLTERTMPLDSAL